MLCLFTSPCSPTKSLSSDDVSDNNVCLIVQLPLYGPIQILTAATND